MSAPDAEPTAAAAGERRVRRIIVIALIAALVVGGALLAVLRPTASPEGVGSPTASPSPSAPSTTAPATPSPSASPTDGDPGAAPDGEVRDEIELDEAAEIAPGLAAAIVRVEAVAGTAQGPGEVAGDAVRVTVSISNTTGAEVSLRTAVVSGYFGEDRDPAPELREPGGRPLPAAVGATSEVDGVYLFVVPEDERDDVTIIVDYSVDVDPLVFRGDIGALIAP